MFTQQFFKYVRRLAAHQQNWFWIQNQTSTLPDMKSIMLDDQWQEIPISPAETVFAAPDGNQAKLLSERLRVTVFNIARITEKFIAEHKTRLIIVLNAHALKMGTASQLMRSRLPILMISNRQDTCEDNAFLATSTPDNMINQTPRRAITMNIPTVTIEISPDHDFSIVFRKKEFIEKIMEHAPDLPFPPTIQSQIDNPTSRIIRFAHTDKK